MQRRKGISVALWIWILGGIAVAFIIFLAFFSNLAGDLSTQVKRDMLNQAISIRDSADLACSSGIGYRSFEQVSLKGVQAIYTSDDKTNVNPKAPNLIANKNISSGKNICISFDHEDFRCFELSCLINMTYIGTPQIDSDMYLIGSQDGVFEFDISINKLQHGFIEINATHIP